MSGWLNIVGIGEDGLDGLSPAARALVDTAEILVGGERHLAMIPADHPAERLHWGKPFDDSFASIEAHAGRRVTVLTTGDPMYFGAGAVLSRRMKDAIATVIPAPGAFSLAASRMRILANDGNTPARIAGMLAARGFGDSRVTALEHMGGPRENRHEALAKDWGDGPVADLNTVAVECVAAPGAQALSRVAGLPDDAFEHDGKMTKREVRAATLAALAPLPGQLLWDVGAGCGSVAIEWMRADGCAIGIENNPDRMAMAARNAALLGVPDLKLVAGEAPAALQGLDAPDAVFVGGGIGTDGLFEACWDALRSGGKLIVNTVTIEGEAALAGLHREHGGELVRLSISRLSPVGKLHGWRPLMTVTQWQVTKA